MNTRIAYLLVALLVPLAPLRAEESPPRLSFVQAAQIAQETLQKQDLPKEYFLRSLSLVYPRDGGPAEKYEARFEPVVVQRATAEAETPSAPIQYKVIVISMDGAAAVEEKTIEQPPRVIRRRAVSSDSVEKQ